MNEFYSLTRVIDCDTVCIARTVINIREIKPIEVRKKEILEAAVGLFNEKGYDRTSISDIAKSLGISQGLCYRYFSSKEEIFECAVDAYAQFICDKMIKILNQPNVSIPDMLKHYSCFTNIEKESSYYEMFHSQTISNFHDRLSLVICRKILPHIEQLLISQVERGYIKIDDPKTTASFICFGQLGILLDNNISLEERNKRIGTFLEKILKEVTC